jgi:hypothetical protein
MCYILIGLPLLLWPLAGWSSPVLAVLISFLLLGVENIGAFIEEPFHVSRMKLCMYCPSLSGSTWWSMSRRYLEIQMACPAARPQPDKLM